MSKKTSAMSSMRRSVTTYRTIDGVADPSPDVGNWRRSLRTLNPDAQKRLSYSGDLFKPRDLTQDDLKPDRLDATAALEKEYIKSLQQHIYLLELENSHLRSQSGKAVSLQPAKSADAERMLLEMQSLDAKIEALQLENTRKDNALEQLQRRIMLLTSRLAGQEDARLTDRKDGALGAGKLQLDRDALQQRVAQLRARIAQLESDSQLDGSLRLAEDRVRSLRDQLETALDKLAKADAAISAEREAVSRLDGQVRRLEQQLAAGSIGSPEVAAAVRSLREENLRLRRHLESAARPEDLTALARRNAALETAVQRLQAELLKTRAATADSDAQAAVSAATEEAARLRERERQLELQATRNAQEASELRRRLAQLEGEIGVDAGGVAELARQCQQLRRDNSQLAEHVRGLEAALERTRAEKAAARAAVNGSESRLGDLQNELNKLQQLQATRWSEVERIATTIRTAAKTNSEIFDPKG